MIDRYAIFSDFKDINARYGLVGEEFTVPNYNASPSQLLPVISNQSTKEITFYHWALNKQWSNNKAVSSKLMTTNTDVIQKKNTMLKALSERRCLIPANGFYLWKLYSKKRRTPHYFSHPEEEMISLVGIWEEFEDLDNNTVYTFKILERPNYLGQAEYGDFLPVVVTREKEKKWLDSYSSTDELLDIALEDELVKGLTNHPVSPHITDVKVNSADLIKPQSQVDQLGNYTLFD